MSADLISRLPSFIQKYDELVRLADSQNPEFDMVWQAESLLRRNIFIMTAGEEGLGRYEKMLGLTSLPGGSIEIRRNRVLEHWNNNISYTFRFLLYLLETILNGNFEIRTDFDNYEIELNLFDVESSVLADLEHVRQIIPANIVFRSNLKSKCEIKGKINNGAAIVQIIEIRI